MRLPLQLCSIVLLATAWITLAQNTGTPQPPKPLAGGVYEVDVSELKVANSVPKVEFPRELSAYEITDKVILSLTISPDGKVIKAKAVKGNIDVLKETAEKTVKRWLFQPYLVNGTPVTVRTEITFNFDNSLDHYREPNGDAPVRLDPKDCPSLVTKGCPSLIKRVPPQYPYDARNGRIQGQVELRVIIGEDGSVRGLHILRGHPMLAPAAYDAVRQWKYKPYTENGKTLPVDTTVTINFSLAG